MWLLLLLLRMVIDVVVVTKRVVAEIAVLETLRCVVERIWSEIVLLLLIATILWILLERWGGKVIE